VIALINPLRQAPPLVGGGLCLLGAIACLLLPALLLTFYPDPVMGAARTAHYVLLLTMTAISGMCAMRFALRFLPEDTMGMDTISSRFIRKEGNPWL